MTPKRFLSVIAVMLAAVMWLSCTSDSPTSTAPLNQIPDLSQTPREDYEAEVAAMVVSHELIAPQWLYERISFDLESIRDVFGDSLPVREITFVPLCYPSLITAKVDTLLLKDSLTRGIQIFDSLSQLYRLRDSSSHIVTSVWLDLWFQGVLNPCHLVELYSQVPGFKTIFPNPHLGSLPEIQILLRGNTLLYCFHSGSGDCPSGCIHSRYYYFQTTQAPHRYKISYIGSYAPVLNHPELAPAWFDTALIARDSTNYLCSWSAGST